MGQTASIILDGLFKIATTTSLIAILYKLRKLHQEVDCQASNIKDLHKRELQALRATLRDQNQEMHQIHGEIRLIINALTQVAAIGEQRLREDIHRGAQNLNEAEVTEILQELRSRRQERLNEVTAAFPGTNLNQPLEENLPPYPARESGIPTAQHPEGYSTSHGTSQPTERSIQTEGTQSLNSQEQTTEGFSCEERSTSSSSRNGERNSVGNNSRRSRGVRRRLQRQQQTGEN